MSVNRMPIYKTAVDPDWIDGNGHVSDRYYTTVFSDAEVAFLEHIGADREYRIKKGGHVYTAENHLTFIKEILLDDQIEVSVGIVDFSNKALHLSFEMKNARGHLCAHHETLVLHVHKDVAGTPRVRPFDEQVLERICKFTGEFGRVENSEYCGTPIGIRRSG